jgi:hypothetical protein
MVLEEDALLTWQPQIKGLKEYGPLLLAPKPFDPKLSANRQLKDLATILKRAPSDGLTSRDSLPHRHEPAENEYAMLCHRIKNENTDLTEILKPAGDDSGAEGRLGGDELCAGATAEGGVGSRARGERPERQDE